MHFLYVFAKFWIVSFFLSHMHPNTPALARGTHVHTLERGRTLAGRIQQEQDLSSTRME